MKKAQHIFVNIQFTEADKITPVSLSGASSIKFMIKLNEADADVNALITKVPTSVSGPANIGKAITTITAAESNTWPNNRPLFSEALAVLADGSVVRTETQVFVFTLNLIKALS